MKQVALTQFPLPWLPTIALLLFFAFFVGMLIYITRRQNNPQFEHAADLPLSDGAIDEDEKQ